MRLFFFVGAACAVAMALSADPVNTLCPVGNEPIDPSAPTISYGGHEIGFCCPGCDDEFLSWSADKRDAFVARAVALKNAQPEAEAPDNTLCPVLRTPVDPAVPTITVGETAVGFATAGAAREFKLWEADRQAAYARKIAAGAELGDPYTLPTCPVSGERLGEMGDPVLYYHEGRELRFCCEGCVGTFEADPAKYLKAVDAEIKRQQRDIYPLSHCVVMPSDEIGEQATERVWRNRLIRLCCGGCIRKFEKDPAKYIAILDEAVREKQAADYPLDHCVVMPDDSLSEHHESYDLVVGGRLVRLCCPGCESELLAAPWKYLETLDNARK